MDLPAGSAAAPMPGERAVADSGERPLTVAAPRVELPKGGGAVRGIGEKFAANPATGTGSLTLPLATSPGRAGFGPALALSYDSGAGNGAFGFGWSLALPAVSRKTDKGLPRYDDAAESDVFLLSGTEDLVPVLDADGSRVEDRGTAPGHVIHRYRPRVEGLFARIERWTRTADGDVHWRSVSRDNVLTLYGKDARSRIADPTEARRVGSWLICETRDDRGNAVLYDYKAEDGAGVDLAAAHQRNRGPRDDPRRTAARHLKRIRYGNRTPLLDAAGRRPAFLTGAQVDGADWMFEVVLDYGEHDLSVPRPTEVSTWAYRPDPFSTYRYGFEVRTARRCRRVLMFHHFAQEPGVGVDCLVRSTDLSYADELDPPDPRAPVHSFIRSATQCGYRRDGEGYVKRSLPPVELGYSVPTVQGTVQEVDATSLENLPSGLDGSAYRWVDLHGEGVPGLLTEQAGAWFYKRNTSPVSARAVEFAAVERVALTPNVALDGGRAQLLDLVGDGLPDVVAFDGAVSGFHRNDGGGGWEPFHVFPARLSRDTRDPAVRFVDLDGDGRADVLISEDDGFCWHPSLAEDGFGPALRVPGELDEETGPRLVLTDPEQSVHLADLTGDGLADLVRVRNGEVCYWPNLGHGRFGAKVAMDGAPHFDRPDRFDQRRVRLADVDGSGRVDIVYLGADGVTVYFNQSGNSWSAGQPVAAFPAVDDVAAIEVADLMGNGTACLVWSSALPGDATRPMRYVDLMGGQKPHLLVRVVNNLGAETTVHYAPSTRFALADKLAGRPWVTKLPFPVHVVERVETVDRIAGNRFVTRSAYHHGYFDGAEREFRGFGLVELWDTEELGTLGEVPDASNLDASSHVPPVLTRTWFHTGAPAGVAGSLEDHYRGEYYQEPEAGGLLLDDTVLPPGLGPDEEREACRALKGAMLRQEVYALDGSDRESDPYLVTEQNLAVRMLQPRAGNRHAVFLTHPREALTVHYERDPADPRVTHALTLDVDDFGNVLTSAAVAYGRRRPDPALAAADQERQAERHVTCTESAFTDPVEEAGAYRAPLPSESRDYELGGLAAGSTPLPFDLVHDAVASAEPLPYEQSVTDDRLQKRLIEHVRIRYRPDDLGAAAGDPLALLPAGRLESRALPGESYRLALTPGLVAERLGDKVDDGMLATDGGYLHVEGDAGWWQRSGRVFLSPGADDDPAAELAHARRRFFQPYRFRDPFHRPGFETESVLDYDVHDLSVRETRDALGNVTTAVHDYRVLQPILLTDPNGNRSEVAFDALGMVAGTAVAGKTSESKGDSLLGFVADLDESVALAQFADPLADPHAILGRASTRLVYDLFAYRRSREEAQPQPAAVATLTRETHDADLAGGELTRVQHAFSYSDGFGREIQRKAQAEPGLLAPGGAEVDPRWVGSGWTILNAKGRPVRRYEPFFSATHRFELARTEGVSPVLLYDPVGRVIATLHPDHSWEKVVIGGWRQESWDRNDTVLIADPAEDPDVADQFRRLPPADYLPSWHARRSGGALGTSQQEAAAKAAEHAGTPGVTHLDSLGRAFLTVAHNRSGDPPEDTFVRTRTTLDIDGNQREVVDALDRVVMSYDHDLLGNQIHSISMDAGERWSLADAAGRALYACDSRGHRHRTGYDVLGRPVESHLRTGSGVEQLVARTRYGEGVPAAETRNLRGQPHQVFDGAGVLTIAEYDFKGNAVRTSRRFAADHKAIPDWSAAVPLDAEEYTTRTVLDALGRPVEQVTPDGSSIRRAYSQAGLLETVEANLRGETAAEQPVWTRFVTALDYDAKGQRTRIERGNGAVTTYDYDPVTFRLLRLRTDHGTELLQDLSYSYDPTGNITRIQDSAQQTVFFRNRRVEPSNDYRYDAIYQLVEATGREHLGQLGGERRAPTPPDPFGLVHGGHDQPGDGDAMGLYVERYRYDPVGNIVETRHVGSDPAHPGWTRACRYAEPGLIDGDQLGNRLSSTQAGAGPAEAYTHDGHGNMTSMPHLPVMRWNHRDQLDASARQVVTDGTAETTYYVYDGAGRRVRKVTERAAGPDGTPTRMTERRYLGGVEVYREYDGTGVGTTLERETLHVLDDRQRVAMVETRTVGDDGSAAQLTRYHLGNHLGSASLELDGGGQVVSYEEYYPYGSTSYAAVDARLGPTADRYRYTGKERDEETGLDYFGARYYAPFLGRWTACDPAGPVDGWNLYRYGRNSPSVFIDPDGREDASWTTSFFGGLRYVGGALQVVAGGVFAAQFETFGLGQAAGVLAIAHGISDMEVGQRQFLSGRTEQSIVVAGVSGGMELAGFDPVIAEGVGESADFAGAFLPPSPTVIGKVAPELVAVQVGSHGTRTMQLAGAPARVEELTNVSLLTQGTVHLMAATDPPGDPGGGGPPPQNNPLPADFGAEIARAPVALDELSDAAAAQLADVYRVTGAPTSPLGRDLFRQVRDVLARENALSPEQKANAFEAAVEEINRIDASWFANRQPATNAVGLFTGDARPFGLAIDDQGNVWQTLDVLTGTTIDDELVFTVDFDNPIWQLIQP